MRGSRNVTNSGKEENVMVPTATVESWIDSRNDHQCRARIAPARISRSASLFVSRKLCFRINIYKLRATDENSTLPKVMQMAGR